MTNLELIKLLQAYPNDALVQINFPSIGSKDISNIHVEDEYNNTYNFKGEVYIDIVAVNHENDLVGGE